ncbi:MAG: gliding motility-associated C-terminal domain-containing protein [Flavobacteriales bacterium]|nr:gliding motility-associated C-terminal domain-containing protein [Flavobacteriales bacterium]
MKRIVTIIFALMCLSLSAQVASVQFVENKGQWHENVAYRARIPAGNLYIESKRLTYQFINEQDLARLHDMHHHMIKNPQPKDYLLNLHAFHVDFLNASQPELLAADATNDYENYYLGNDPQKWASYVKKYTRISYKNLYPKTDLKFYMKEGYLKYDFVLAPGADAGQIQLKYDGVDELYIEKGKLVIRTSVNEIIEQEPVAFQIKNGKQKEIKCNFKLEGNVVSFEFPKGYDHTKELVIDPTLIFASYTGSTSDNWGYTSTFDDDGNLYGGGVVFGAGYPTTVGAYQTSFSGGNGAYAGCDISISKFTSAGNNLMYSTYLGGAFNESPHSLIVNGNNELLILGTTASADYPVTVGAYDNTYNAGTSYTGSIPNYIGGSDIIITKLNAAGTALLASTFVGGTGNDGLNQSTILQYNYADDYRGEIIVDTAGNVYVASSTLSADFPVSAGAIQPALSGMQEGCAFKMDANLSTLLWSTYLGGSSDDAAYSLQFDQNGNVVITGGTQSADFPVTGGVLQPAYQGNADAWITILDNNASSIIASTFLGTPDYDQAFFVQLDTANNVYVVGQTEGTYPITPATVYNNPNSGQFIHKLTPDLTTTVFSTTVGTSSGEVDIALSAFLVNECNYIFVSGWGGNVNVFNGGAPFSTTNGLPITPGAIQATTDGSDYYLMLLSENADTLMYSTFFGGNSSYDHVDGGTSRFDKRGIVYQAVCSSCGGNNDFPTTPGAWSNNNNANNCNLGVFKIDLTAMSAGASVYATPYHCIGDTVRFQNLSNGGISFYWEFGDGDTSTLFEPVHVYANVGTYHVMLVSLDSVSCIQRDTDYVDVFVGGPPVIQVNPVNGVCRGDSSQLSVVGGVSYQWSPNYNLSNDTASSPMAWPDTTTTYTVIMYDTCGIDTGTVTVEVYQKHIDIIADTMICLGQTVQLNATGGGSYAWSPGVSLSNPNIQQPTAMPNANTTYTVQITDTNNCLWDTTMTVLVDSAFPVAQVSVVDTICYGDTVEIYASGGTFYSWSPASSLATPSDSSTLAFPTQTTTYTVVVSNGCGSDLATLDVHVHVPNATIVDDTMVCIGSTANLWAAGGVSYNWYTSSGKNYGTQDHIHPVIHVPTTFYVDVTDSINCTITLSVFVDTLPNPYLEIGYDITTNWGKNVILNPITNGVVFSWSPPEGLSCTDCPNPTVTALETSTYYLEVQGANGCYSYDTITVYFDGSIYVPNSFTPLNPDGTNDIFFAYGKDILEFEMFIFDRWGEQLFYSDDMTVGWDGTYQGKMVQTESYVWKIKYKDVIGQEGELYGTVTLIR